MSAPRRPDLAAGQHGDAGDRPHPERIGRRRFIQGLGAVAGAGALTTVLPPGAAHAAVPEGASSYRSLATAVRVLDTREPARYRFRTVAPNRLRLKIAGTNGVPRRASALVLTVTAVNASQPNFLTVFPSDAAVPLVSNLNLVGAGDVAANLVTVKTGTDSSIDLFSLASCEVIVDVLGYYQPQTTMTREGRFVGLATARRAIDTRPHLVGNDSVTVVDVSRWVPPDASSVVINLTATESTGPGFFTAFGFSDAQVPGTSSLNVAAAGSTRAAAMIVPVDDVDGRRRIKIFALTPAKLIVDVAGYFTGPTSELSQDGLFVPLVPVRILDTRRPGEMGKLWAEWVVEAAVTGRAASGASAIAGNLTAADTRAAGFLTMSPARLPIPPTSNVNVVAPGSVVANHVITPITSCHGFQVFSSHGSHVVFDIAGYFTGVPATPRLPRYPNPAPSTGTTGARAGHGAGGPRHIVCVVVDDPPHDAMQALPCLAASPMGSWVDFPNGIVSRPLCAPSRATIHSGMYARRHGVLANPNAHGELESRWWLPDRALIGAQLHDHGYRTGMFGKYHLPIEGDRGRVDAVAVGWDRWVAVPDGSTVYFDYRLNDDGNLVDHRGSGVHLTDHLFDEAIEWMVSDPATPTFAYLALKAPHLPAVPPARFADSYTLGDLTRPPNYNVVGADEPSALASIPPLDARQLAVVEDDHLQAFRTLRAVDDGMHRLLNAIEEAGMLADTAVFFLADNSNIYGAHRLTGKGHLFEECIRAHLRVRWPASPANRTSSAVVSNIDLAPTFAEIGGFELPEPPDGRSMMSLLDGHIDDDEFRVDTLVERPTLDDFRARGIRRSRWKFIRYRTGEEALYDLVADPGELANVVTSHPDRADEMRASLLALEASLGDGFYEWE